MVEIVGATHEGFPLKQMSHDILMEQGVDTLCYYVWPYEGVWGPRGKFVFHKGSYTENGVEIDYPTGPLLVDAPSARAYKLVYEAINDENKAKLRGYTEEHRGLFCWAMQTLIWPHVGFGGKK